MSIENVDELIHINEDNPRCPYCDHLHEDIMEHKGDGEFTNCEKCEGEFQMFLTYSTRKYGGE